MTHFTFIGERLNTHRTRLRAKVLEHDAETVVREVRRQQDAGVTHLDINASGTGPVREVSDMLWLLDTVLPVLDATTGLVLDSLNPECLRQALWRVGKRPGTIINAVTADVESQRELIPLAREHQTGLVAILTRGTQAPRSADERLVMAEELRARLREGGIPDERQYFDPQVLPVAFDPHQPRAVLETVRILKQRWPAVHAIAGLSNVSFNMPQRSLLNRTFLGMLLACGVDTLIFDPCDSELREALIAARALLGQDDFFAEYLEALRPED